MPFYGVQIDYTTLGSVFEGLHPNGLGEATNGEHTADSTSLVVEPPRRQFSFILLPNIQLEREVNQWKIADTRWCGYSMPPSAGTYARVATSVGSPSNESNYNISGIRQALAGILVGAQTSASEDDEGSRRFEAAYSAVFGENSEQWDEFFRKFVVQDEVFEHVTGHTRYRYYIAQGEPREGSSAPRPTIVLRVEYP